MLVTLLMMIMMQAEKQRSDAISQCQRAVAERDEAIQGNKFLQIKLKEAEIALKELGQNVTIVSFVVLFSVTFTHLVGFCVHDN